MREIGVPGWAVLAVLADRLPRTHAQIMESCELIFADIFSVNRSTLSRALHRMVNLGHVTQAAGNLDLFKITNSGSEEAGILVRQVQRLITIAAEEPEG